MRNLKKFLALVLATLMVISAAATVSAYSDVADDSVYATAINTLSEYGIVKGIGNDEFGADLSVQRYQMALMMVRALEPESDWNVGGMKVFEDTPEELYGNYFGAIAYARMSGIINGVDDTHFAPADGIKYCDALIMAVRALGYTVDVTASPYWMGAYQTAAKLGLTKNVGVIEPTQVLTRAQTAQLIYNMIKATPADGGATIEQKNFTVPGTQFVITATKQQAYIEGTKSYDAGVVGIQPLVDGVPSGKITYIDAAELGIKTEDVEKYFNYAVGLVNYDEATGDFDRAVLGNAPETVMSTDLTVKDGKLTVGGVTYYISEKLTGAALKNEIVLFNGSAAETQLKKLIVDNDGNVYFENKKVAIIKTEGSTTYYMDLEQNEFISEAEALERYGVKINGATETSYGTLTADKLTKNYQLTLFDDNKDDVYDRGYLANVYMSVFPGAAGKDKESGIAGPATTAKNVVIEGADLAKGDVFVYTYNKDTNTIDVIEVLVPDTGVVGTIDLTKYSEKKIAKVTIDGTTYTIANEVVDAGMGAALQATTTDPVKYADIKKDAKLNFVNADQKIQSIIEVFSGEKQAVNFIAYNGYIVSAAKVDGPQTTEGYMVVVSSTDDFDSTSLTLDAYVAGVRGDYKVTKFINSQGNTIELSKLNIFRLSSEVANFVDDIEGQVFKYKTTDGKTFELTTAKYADKVRDLKLQEAVSVKHEFSNGISKIDTDPEKGYTTDKADRIRTNADTVFYLINTDSNKVTKTVGAPANGDYIDATGDDVKIYADKIGFGTGDAYGIAKTVIVTYTDSDISKFNGFSVSKKADTVVYVVNADSFTVDSAASFGLTGETGTFFKYSTKAINMTTGKTVDIYAKSTNTPATGEFWTINDAGVITAKTAATEKTVSIDYDGDEYITVSADGKILFNVDKKITKVVTNDYTKADPKENVKDLFKDGKTQNVKYMGVSNGTLVLIYGYAGKAPIVETKTTVNAVWQGQSGTDYVAIADVTDKTSEKISGTVYVAVNNTDTLKFAEYGWAKEVTVTGAWDNLVAKDYNPETATITLLDKDKKAIEDVAFGSAKVTLDNGVVTFTVTEKTTTDQWDTNTVKLPTGKIYVKVAFAEGGFFLIPVTVK